MKNLLKRLSEKWERFMIGRRGVDSLTMPLLILSLLFTLIATFTRFWWLLIASLLLIVWAEFRMLSKNLPQRQKEAAAYDRTMRKIRSFFRLQKDKIRDRKTHRYYRCPNCRAVVRIRYPGKGHEITVTCPRCQNRFDKNT